MFILSKVQEGDTIKLSQLGIKWYVFKVAGGNVLNKVIMLKSENGAFRTYCHISKRWNQQVWCV